MNIKKLIASALVLAAAVLPAAAATTVKYQTLVSDATGAVLRNAPVKIKVAIRQDSATGSVVFAEEHAATTNAAGVAYINIGEVNTAATLDDLAWGSTTYFMELAIDRGAGYEALGTTQIMAVPRALYAAEAGRVVLTSPSGKKYAVSVNDKGEVVSTPVND